MARDKLKIGLTGTKQTQAALQKLKGNIRRKVLVESLTKTARQGVSAAKGMLKDKRTGMLKKALDYKTKSKGKDAGYRVIGANRGNKVTIPGWFGATTGKTQKVRLSGKTKGGKIRSTRVSKKASSVAGGLAINPAKYAHLVEGGRKAIAASGRTKSPSYGGRNGSGERQGPGTMAGNAKAMYFRVFGKGGKSSQVFAKKAKAVKPQPFMRPASEKLKLLYPYNVALALQKVWP